MDFSSPLTDEAVLEGGGVVAQALGLACGGHLSLVVAEQSAETQSQRCAYKC